jgi:hypothetical protein
MPFKKLEVQLVSGKSIRIAGYIDTFEKMLDEALKKGD